MLPLPQSERAARAAELVLGHRLSQDFSFRATSALIDISRGSTVIAPDDAELLVHMALRAVVTAEVMAGREVKLMTDVAYHYTTTAHLSWIILTDDLRPSENKISKLPFDFLWATTSTKIDRTSSAAQPAFRQALRMGFVRVARFTLAAEDFKPWPDILESYPEWTHEQQQETERLARLRGQFDPREWRCRVDPLPLDRVIALETKGYIGDWVRADKPSASGRNRWTNVVIVNDPPGTRGVTINGKVYLATKTEWRGQPTGYAILPPVALADMPVPLSVTRIEETAA